MNAFKEIRQARVAELTEAMTWGLSDDEKSELEQAQQDLSDIAHEEARAGRDGERPHGLSLERLEEYESERRCIRRALAAFGLEVAAFRGEAINGFFESYERDAMARSPNDWPTGTRLIGLTYRIPQRYEPGYTTVLFPESYLDCDWKPLEQKRLDALRIIEQEIAEKARQRREAADRAKLAELLEKFPDAA